MPESDLTRINPSSGMDRIEGTPVTDMRAATSNVRVDPHVYAPTYVFANGELPPPPEPPPPPPKPELTEAQARQALADAKAARTAARRKLDDATAAHERGLAHVAGLKRQAAAYAGLQAAIDEHVTEALRLDGHAELSPELRERVTGREISNAELAAAERAAERLSREKIAAVAAYQRTQWPETAALSRTMDFAKSPLRQELRTIELRLDA